jgi:hypothetical protein
MAEYPGGTIDGIPTLKGYAVGWDERAGVDSHEGYFLVRPADAKTLLTGAARPVSIVLQSDERMAFDNLYVISRGVGPDPNLAVVRVVDRRYFWPRIHVGPRRYNIRRKVGTKRMVAPNQVLELAALADDVDYHPASLKDGLRKWTAHEVLEDILGYVVSKEGDFGGPQDVIYQDEFPEIPIEQLQIDDPAPEAIARILAYLPGATMKLDPAGSIVVYSTVDGSEEELVADLGDESVGGGHVEKIDRSRDRPEYVVVEFSRECEIRFDHADLTTNYAPAPDARYMDNVVQIPDYQLNIGGAVGTVPQGTWVEIDSAMAAWNRTGALPKRAKLSKQFLCEAFAPGMSIWTGAGLQGQQVPNTDWMGRIAAVSRGFRQTFRINQRWRDRIHQLRAYRLATIDPENGGRGPATAYLDYSYIGSDKSMYAESAAGVDLSYAMNSASYPLGPLFEITDETRAAPAEVTITDSDQGILSIAMRGDVWRNYDMALPSQIEMRGDNTQPGHRPRTAGPQSDPTALAPIAWNMISRDGAVPQLQRNWRCSVIITATPAYPNDERQLHRIIVYPDQVANLLPNAARGGLTSAFGPPQTVRIGANVEVARTVWDDTKASIVEALFGVDGAGQGLDQGDLSVLAQAITLNADEQSNIGTAGASLNAIALAAAASVYGAYADHHEGGKTVRMSKHVRLSGWAAGLSWSIEPDGSTVTRLELPGARKTLSMFSYMDADTRALVMRTVVEGG